MPPPRWISPALSRALAGWPDAPPYLDSAGGITPTPCREWGVAQQLLLRGLAAARLKPTRAKAPGTVRG